MELAIERQVYPAAAIEGARWHYHRAKVEAWMEEKKEAEGWRQQHRGIRDRSYKLHCPGTMILVHLRLLGSF
jgi:hypothetical protein